MKRVVITGASRGIGRASAEKFLEQGYFVIGLSRTIKKHIIKSENFAALTLDLATSTSIKKVATEIKNKFKNVDILINNAGILADYHLSEVKVSKLRQTLEVNLIGLVDFTENLLTIINSGGSILILSSGRGSLTQSHYEYNAPSYNISKTAVLMYTKLLAARLSKRNITVSAIDPGWVRTAMGGAGADRDPNEAAEDIFKLATRVVESGKFWHKGRQRPW